MTDENYCNQINILSQRFKQFKAFMRDGISCNTGQLLVNVFRKVRRKKIWHLILITININYMKSVLKVLSLSSLMGYHSYSFYFSFI